MYKKYAMPVLLMGLLVLPNCAKYRPTPISHTQGDIQEIGNVKIVARQLSTREIATCFDSKHLAKKYVAIQLSAKNKSDKSVVLSANNFNVPVVSSKDISKTMYRNTAGRVGGYVAGSLFLWPLIIPAAVDGVKSSEANSQINRDVADKVLGLNEKVVIRPKNSVSKIIFIEPKDIKNKLVVSLSNKDLTQELDFKFVL